ncbi:hypothetical protein KHQ81_09340 [Mycoplasmatota bacterium]|nr:hypothetical protein KHQ81_09340 [Mycoplasmatota bacterium]
MKKKIDLSWKDKTNAHSFVRALYTCLNHSGYKTSLAEVAGRSGFAFRIITEKNLCPSAMSVFDWELLPKGAINCGYEIKYTQRLWHEEQLEKQRRDEALEQIKNAIDNNQSAIVWDVAIPEWELITGYDDELELLFGLSIDGSEVTLEYGKLGKREIPILSVTTIIKENNLTKKESLRNVLQTILNHYNQLEFCEQPNYQNGKQAYLQWANALENTSFDSWGNEYYIKTYESMRKLAYEYFCELSEKYKVLIQVKNMYGKVHEELYNALKIFEEKDLSHEEVRNEYRAKLLRASEFDSQAIHFIYEILNKNMI